MRALGKRQQTVMSSLETSNNYPHGGWYYGSHSETVEVLESLVGRGLVERTGDAYNGRYRLKEGPKLEEYRAWAEELRQKRRGEWEARQRWAREQRERLAARRTG